MPDKRSREMVFSYKPREGAEDMIYNLISDICISMKAVDYLEMPECVYNRVILRRVQLHRPDVLFQPLQIMLIPVGDQYRLRGDGCDPPFNRQRHTG